MTTHTTIHCSFSIERHLSAPPAQVFNAWATPELKKRWFCGPEEWSSIGYQLDFRVGGNEHLVSGPAQGPMHVYDAHIEDIVPNERIVYSYDMSLDDERRVSVSLATIELEPEGDGTRLVFTEEDVFLDDAYEEMSREQGTRLLLDQLENELRRERPLA
ncbi:MAG TPA: SRPBCC family protein [Gammaproteobacteria bacterium]